MLNTCTSKHKKLDTQFLSRLSQEVVERVWESSERKRISKKPWNHAKDNRLSRSAMTECWLKSTSLSQDISKFKCLVTWWKTTFIFTKETVQSKDAIKRSLKKLLQTFHKPSDLKSVNQPLKLPELLDITMQVPSNSFLTSIQTSIISWKWTQDCKLSIQFLKWSQVLILCNGNCLLQVDSPCLKSNTKFKRRVMPLK